jgi:hypothetical protein
MSQRHRAGLRLRPTRLEHKDRASLRINFTQYLELLALEILA